MNPIPYTIPISDLRFQQTSVLARVEDSPVLLTRQGRAVAVLVDPAHWNRLIEEFEDLADSLAVTQTKLALARQEEELIDWETVTTPTLERGGLLQSCN